MKLPALPDLRSSSEAVVIPVVAMLVAMIPFGIFLKLAGASPIEAFELMFKGAFGTATSWQDTLLRATPLMLAALCTALPARLGMIIIGGEGAVVLGGLAAAIVPHFLLKELPNAQPMVVVIPAMAIAGIAIGGLWIMLAGALRYYRGVNETISSLLLTYIAFAIFNHLVEGIWRDPESLNKPSTWPIPDAMQLPAIGDAVNKMAPNFQPWVDNLPADSFKGEFFQFLTGAVTSVHIGFIFALVVCIGLWIFIEHTTYGFAARIVGGNLRAARVAGLSVGKLTLLICFLAGGAAGLAGMVQVSAVEFSANATGLIAGYGFAGILVAFMARQSPLGVIPVSLLLGGIQASNGLLQRHLNLPDATVRVLQGILFVMILASESYYGRFKIFRRREPSTAAPPSIGNAFPGVPPVVTTATDNAPPVGPLTEPAHA